MKRKVILLSAVLVLVYIFVFIALTGCKSGTENRSDQSEADQASGKYLLKWQDEFDYSGLPDSTKWAYDIEGNEARWGNNEAQFYTTGREKNSQVDKGVLKITAHKENFEGREFTSARLVSKSGWRYGKFEVRAKIPPATGTWSAIWMMPDDWSYNDGNWPDVGEIDIMEHVGHNPGIVHASAHSKEYQWQKQTQKTAIISVQDATETFHTYTLEWSPDLLMAFVDDSLFFQYENEGLGEEWWPYNKPFNIILNVAVGGTWGDAEGIDGDAFPQSMEIDYVRVYQKDGLSEK